MIRSVVKPGNVIKKFDLIACSNVGTVGEKRAACRYDARSADFLS